MKEACSILPQPAYPIVHQLLKRLFPHCLWELPPGSWQVALTFDDGPHPDYTPEILQILDQLKLKGSFFVLGRCVERWPHLIQAIWDNGHHIGIHGYDHRSFPSLAPADLHQDLSRTQNLIATACRQDPALFRDVRPPNGLFLPHTLSQLQAWQYRPVMWSVVPEDWLLPPVETVVQRILNQVYPGALIVLHDGIHGGVQVADTVRILMPRLHALGYDTTTLARS